VAAVAVAVVAAAAALPAGLARYWLAPGGCSGSGAALAGIAIRQILVCPGLGLYTHHRRCQGEAVRVLPIGPGGLQSGFSALRYVSRDFRQKKIGSADCPPPPMASRSWVPWCGARKGCLARAIGPSGWQFGILCKYRGRYGMLGLLWTDFPSAFAGVGREGHTVSTLVPCCQ
jgi:hypothetical protein